MIDVRQFGLEPHSVPAFSVGDRFGRLTVVATGKRPGTYRYMAVCDCECGAKEVVVRYSGARTAQSCGCLQRESATKHGCWSHRLFPRWKGMMQRCYDPKNDRWKDYGARGIAVCDRWHDPNNFIADMDGSFEPGLELDRIDGDKGYSVANCRWVTHTEQAGNKRSVRLITYEGRTMNMAQWAKETGIPHGTILYRVRKLGWSDEKAVSTPSMPPKERLALATKARWG